MSFNHRPFNKLNLGRSRDTGNTAPCDRESREMVGETSGSPGLRPSGRYSFENVAESCEGTMWIEGSESGFKSRSRLGDGMIATSLPGVCADKLE